MWSWRGGADVATRRMGTVELNSQVARMRRRGPRGLHSALTSQESRTQESGVVRDPRRATGATYSCKVKDGRAIVSDSPCGALAHSCERYTHLRR